MRAIGQGHSRIEKFTSLVNLPKPMTQNNYDKIVNKITDVVKIVAEESMSDAANDLRERCVDSESILNTGVSCDGSWQ